MTSKTTNPQGQEATMLTTPTTSSKFDIRTLKLHHEVWSPNVGHDLVVVGLDYGRVATEDVLSGAAKPIEARLSADGSGWSSEWHQGESSGRECYVERHDVTGCVFHGWIDQDSRRLVQAG